MMQVAGRAVLCDVVSQSNEERNKPPPPKKKKKKFKRQFKLLGKRHEKKTGKREAERPPL
jgi:hypothetical protein